MAAHGRHDERFGPGTIEEFQNRSNNFVQVCNAATPDRHGDGVARLDLPLHGRELLLEGCANIHRRRLREVLSHGEHLRKSIQACVFLRIECSLSNLSGPSDWSDSAERATQAGFSRGVAGMGYMG